MMAATKRIALGAVATALIAGLAGCSGTGAGGAGSGTGKKSAADAEEHSPAAAPKGAVKVIGDGSTAYTGAQPKLPVAKRLKAGQKPPQFVVFSWDGAGRTARSSSRTSAVSRRSTTRP